MSLSEIIFILAPFSLISISISAERGLKKSNCFCSEITLKREQIFL